MSDFFSRIKEMRAKRKEAALENKTSSKGLNRARKNQRQLKKLHCFRIGLLKFRDMKINIKGRNLILGDRGWDLRAFWGTEIDLVKRIGLGDSLTSPSLVGTMLKDTSS